MIHYGHINIFGKKRDLYTHVHQRQEYKEFASENIFYVNSVGMYFVKL